MPFLDDAIKQAQMVIEQRFLFRKLGLPYDYATPPDEFPAKTIASAKEARANLPNPQGSGSGYFHSCRNHALLFDSYLLRIELGIESGNDEQIFDRLIGGLIRIATIAPKSFLVGGLAPDGRGFYAWTSRENHAAWSFAIAPDSQEKFRSIVGKRFDRLERDKFILHSVDGKPLADGGLAAVDARVGPVFLAIQLTSALVSDEVEKQDRYNAAAEEGERARLRHCPPVANDDSLTELLWRQAALAVVADYDFNPERVALARERMLDNAHAVSAHIAAWREWDKSLIDEPVDWDWRACAKGSPADTGGLGFVPPPSWQRLANEKTLVRSLNAMYIALLARDEDAVTPHAAEMEECLVTTPWDKVACLAALAPVIGVHARGAEFGLWDKGLFDARHNFQFAEESLAAKYLEPDYDKENPGQAGHKDPPPGKRQEEAPGRAEGGKRRKRRRRR